MIPFALDWKRVFEQYGGDPSTHQRFLNCYEKYGLLISGKGELRKIRETLFGFGTQATRDLWLQRLKDDETNGWILTSEEKPLDESLEAFLKFADAEKRLEVLALRDMDAKIAESRKLGRCGYVPFGEADLAPAVYKYRECTCEIEKQESPNDIWYRHFRLLAEVANQVVIRDRYLLSNEFRASNGGALKKLLQLLWNSGGRPKTVTILSSIGDEEWKATRKDTAREAFEEGKTEKRRSFAQNAIRGILLGAESQGGPSDAIRAVKMNGKAGQHDRYIRFDRHLFLIGTGMDIFDENRTGERSSTFMTRSYLYNSNNLFRTVETNLRNFEEEIWPPPRRNGAGR